MTPENAKQILMAHHVEVLGTTETGVCVVDVYCSCSFNVWVPANIKALRDFLNY